MYIASACITDLCISLLSALLCLRRNVSSLLHHMFSMQFIRYRMLYGHWGINWCQTTRNSLKPPVWLFRRFSYTTRTRHVIVALKQWVLFCLLYGCPGRVGRVVRLNLPYPSGIHKNPLNMLPCWRGSVQFKEALDVNVRACEVNWNTSNVLSKTSCVTLFGKRSLCAGRVYRTLHVAFRVSITQ